MYEHVHICIYAHLCIVEGHNFCLICFKIDKNIYLQLDKFSVKYRDVG